MSVLRVPDRTFTIPILVRGTIVWGSLRAALALATWLMTGLERPTLEVTVGAAAWGTLVVGALGLLEIRRRNEHMLLANLGYGQGLLAAVAAVPALIGEIAISLALTHGAARS